MQRVTEKYADTLAVVAVNIVADQDDDVLPFLKEHRYTFTAYKMNDAIRKAYGVHGAPMEFLIDRRGGAVLQLRLSSDEREKQLGEYIEKLAKEPK